ncbi:host specificity protein [Shigella flexneri]|nr:host specificity protein [Shigella flexneri]
MKSRCRPPVPLISLVDGNGNPVSVEVQSVTDGVKVKVSRVPDGVAEYSVWGLKLPTLRQRLFRCVSIRENDDGTYAITAVQHVPEKRPSWITGHTLTVTGAAR